MDGAWAYYCILILILIIRVGAPSDLAQAALCTRVSGSMIRVQASATFGYRSVCTRVQGSVFCIFSASWILSKCSEHAGLGFGFLHLLDIALVRGAPDLQVLYGNSGFRVLHLLDLDRVRGAPGFQSLGLIITIPLAVASTPLNPNTPPAHSHGQNPGVQVSVSALPSPSPWQ
jgi:hypothetical protein